MKIKEFVVVVFFIICASCNDKKTNQAEIKKDDDVSTGSVYSDEYNNKEKTDKLLNKIVHEGDTTAYNNLAEIYFLSGHRLSFLYVSILMANKHKYSQAYYDVYNCLYNLNSKNDNNEEWIFNENTDTETIKYALDCLKKAEKGGVPEAKKILKFYRDKELYKIK
ncbi:MULTISPECIES: hypothetical protein [unclassified Flavobacterium]|uniref:hypothetical protein n=1 Tax=unclassified Flavobacterium TaxID=196869 RepID=UPI0003487817|nr:MULTISPECIES: hypothetical protein [unclassified Flavobacterium]URC11764.1 hypothetical protein M4I44_16905 [Flavobacterium sp. B183]